MSLTSTVQHIFNTANTAEFHELVELCGYEVSTEDHLSIVKWTASSNNDIIPPIKGLIYNTESGQIMAPGVHIPLAVQPSGTETKCIGYSRPIDGVMVRVWWNGDYWHWSTNGMITPKKLEKHDFQILLRDARKPIEDSFYNLRDQAKHRELCYFFILENVANPLLVMPMDDQLTFVRALDNAGNTVNDYDSYFSRRTEISYVSREVCDSVFEDLNTSVDPKTTPADCSVKVYALGVIYHYEDCKTFRRLTDNATLGQKLRPNFPTVAQHWVYHVHTMDSVSKITEEVQTNPLYMYKRFFPWHAHTIDGLNAFFLKELALRNCTVKCIKFVKALKQLTDKYLSILYAIENPANWTYTPQVNSSQEVVSVPYLGDFPDRESADMSVNKYMQCPATLF